MVTVYSVLSRAELLKCRGNKALIISAQDPANLYKRLALRNNMYDCPFNYHSLYRSLNAGGDAWSSSGNILDSYNTMHTCAYLIQLRRYIEAVINYTGALKVDVIAHSLGVPLARKVGQHHRHIIELYLLFLQVLKGGNLIATDGCVLHPMFLRVT